MTQGAVADCINRFPMVAMLIRTFFPSFVKKASEDTAKHETYTMDLVKR